MFFTIILVITISGIKKDAFEIGLETKFYWFEWHILNQFGKGDHPSSTLFEEYSAVDCSISQRMKFRNFITYNLDDHDKERNIHHLRLNSWDP